MHMCPAGSAGPLFVVFGGDDFPRSKVDYLNSRYKGRVFITHSGKKSHMMNSDLTIHMYHTLFTPAFMGVKQCGLDSMLPCCVNRHTPGWDT